MEDTVTMPTRTKASQEAAGLLDKLKSQLQPSDFVGHQLATYTCGGSIPINASPTRDAKDSAPVVIRWDTPSTGDGAEDTEGSRRITFPIVDDANHKAFEALLSDGVPATFGKGNVPVLDESYRKAKKLQAEEFSTNFSPYEAGIIDVIAQVLLPSLNLSAAKKSIRAELYALNVYSGPSGKFKAHVDTPRTVDQVGSLVVSLPTVHKGGSLAVRHHKDEVVFDWSASTADIEKAPSIKWAAFYSDCEHEIFEVVEGHRVTLTYNLYATRGNGMLTGAQLGPLLSPDKLPIYRTIKQLLGDPTFCPKGAYVGFYSMHAYPHASETVALPSCLKGADMAIYEALLCLRLNPLVKTVVDLSDIRSDEDDEIYNSRAGPPGPVQDMGETEYWDYDLDHVFNWVFGNNATRNGGEDENKVIPSKDIEWLNVGVHQDLQGACIMYGNQPSLGLIYAKLSILAWIPPADDPLRSSGA